MESRTMEITMEIMYPYKSDHEDLLLEYVTV